MAASVETGSIQRNASRVDQLRIDRSAAREPRSSRTAWLSIVGAIAIAAIAAAAWAWVDLRPGGIAVDAAVAQPIASGGTAAPASALDASGYVVANRQATVSSKITGKLTEVLFEEGQRVKAGQVLARLDDTNVRAQWNHAKAQVDLARTTIRGKEAQVEIARRILDRQHKLQAQGFISGNAVDTVAATFESQQSDEDVARGQLVVAEALLAAAQRDLDDTVVRAPFTGVATVKAAQPGEIISPISAGGGFTRTGIGTIVDMDSLEVDVDVNESFINRIRAGQPAEITLNAYPDWRIPAEVIAVVPTADRTKATVGVRLRFKQLDARILPQMGARVSFLTDAATRAEPASAPRGVSVPVTAIQREGDRAAVFVIHGQKVERRTVRLGAQRGETQDVLAGLAPGDRVALGDLGRLADGAAVRLK